MLNAETPCGGYIQLTSTYDITYELPADGVLRGCAWIVAARSTGPIKIQLASDRALRLTSNLKLGILPAEHSSSGCNYEQIT